MSIATIKGVTSAAVSSGGTIAVSYPTGTTRGDFVIGARHRISVIGKVFSCPEAITVSLGATSATITYNGTTTIPAGSPFTIELDRSGSTGMLSTVVNAIDTYVKPGRDTFLYPVQTVLVSFGTPTTASATAVAAAQTMTGSGTAVVINGAKAASGVASLGAPTGRNVNVVSSNAGDTTQVVTVIGTDMYGNGMRENITCNGTTTVQGKKAFFNVTGATVSATMTGTLSVGDGAILGLPVYLTNSVFIVKEIQDGASATAGTTVAGAGITVPATATSADVRGTYAPNSAPDGTRSCALLVDLPEPNFYGQPQFNG
ncbi:hypothetical protein UFOVP4_12 [uncultured Caudovirales phage]|uniref:Uncharacterized protein n=1 Tax=uncultured Caudovirales phage TaxID=2100421 RepID=A0A6J5T9C4_9CAUD|nr:hypothetical protein UFOVP4_12 [uncultured Caudovirales phage]CAB4241333.1 hypothetical protein UFOVP64_47 [uncultured Caudovirales phage]CAB5078962.1 hypothetical protein UFOVP145_3 [uncultured Caudovirales phage]